MSYSHSCVCLIIVTSCVVRDSGDRVHHVHVDVVPVAGALRAALQRARHLHARQVPRRRTHVRRIRRRQGLRPRRLSQSTTMSSFCRKFINVIVTVLVCRRRLAVPASPLVGSPFSSCFASLISAFSSGYNILHMCILYIKKYPRSLVKFIILFCPFTRWCGQDIIRSVVFGLCSLIIPAGYSNDSYYYQVHE